jgi:hypothetical protein
MYIFYSTMVLNSQLAWVEVSLYFETQRDSRHLFSEGEDGRGSE